MNKVGQTELPWLWITYLVLIGIIIAVFFNYVGEQDDDVSIQKFYLNDITFLVNTMLSSEFDEEYSYRLSENFVVDITKDEVKISLNENVLSKTYVQNRTYKIIYEREGDELIFRRKDGLPA